MRFDESKSIFDKKVQNYSLDLQIVQICVWSSILLSFWLFLVDWLFHGLIPSSRLKRKNKHVMQIFCEIIFCFFLRRSTRQIAHVKWFCIHLIFTGQRCMTLCFDSRLSIIQHLQLRPCRESTNHKHTFLRTCSDGWYNKFKRNDVNWKFSTVSF